jgi:glycosyltransferase involved in cell wall biosynthesis
VAPPPWRPEGNRLTRTPRAHARTVLLLSRLHPVKAIEALLDAWPLVRARRHDARLVIAGDGEAGYVTSLRARVMRNNELPPDIVFAGFLDGLAKDRCFADADVFVLPSYHENFGIAAVEAIASGLPVVISPDVQLSAFVRAHGLGIVANRESGELADALVAALADDDLRRRSATLGPALVEQSFSPTAVGAQLLEMYRAALHRRA